jgi:hypothetical protein
VLQRQGDHLPLDGIRGRQLVTLVDRRTALKSILPTLKEASPVLVELRPTDADAPARFAHVRKGRRELYRGGAPADRRRPRVSVSIPAHRAGSLASRPAGTQQLCVLPSGMSSGASVSAGAFGQTARLPTIRSGHQKAEATG